MYYIALRLHHTPTKHEWLADQGVYNNDQRVSTSEWGLAVGVGDCCWWYAAAGDMCYSYTSLCGHVQQPGSLDSCGHYARRTLMAPLPVAVQSGPFVWKWVYIHLPPNDSPSSPPWAYSTHTHTHRLGKLEATNTQLYQLQQRAFRWCNSPSVGHVGGILLWTDH